MMTTLRNLRKMLKLGGGKIWTYQDTRFPTDQYELISQTTEFSEGKSFVEIGCNAGLLTEMVSKTGRFAVGIDVRQYWQYREYTAGLTVYPITLETVKAIPDFDLVALLSVHHQWVAKQGEAAAINIMKEIFNKARLGVFVEFAALSAKYGAPPNSLFIDNDPVTIQAYAEAFIAKLGKRAKYLGPAREKKNHEPFRYMFLVHKD